MVRLTEKQIEQKMNWIRKYEISSNPADGSNLDANANVTNKTVVTMQGELYKDFSVQVNRALIREKIENEFGKELADNYIEDLESHLIYSHDETNLAAYCVSLNMYPFLLDGMKVFGEENASDAPTHLRSFCGGYVNLVQYVASQFAGAVATTEFLLYFDYFARKDFGDNYINTHKDIVTQELQGVVYLLNQDSSARNGQSVFSNIATFDKFFFEGIFGDFMFPDLTPPNWDTLCELQKFWHQWFREERTKKLLTFPVVTHCAISNNEGNDWKDSADADFIAEEMSLGGEFFIYTSNTADSLASCCFGKDQKTLTRSSEGVNYLSFEELKNSKYKDTKQNFSIFHNGNWVKGKEVQLPNRDLYKVTTVNNKEVYVTDNHLNPTTRGDVETDKLTLNDYLMFSTKELGKIPERDENLSYDQGFVVGAFLGDGSFGTRHKDRIIYDTNFSMSEDTYVLIMEKLDIVSGKKSGLSKVKNNMYPVRISDRSLVVFIQRWTNWKEGTKANNKELNLGAIEQSVEFRKGILAGWYHTDGGNSNRCYTTSKKMSEQMEVLITSLGMQSVINLSDRTDEKVVIRGIEYNRNYPLYCVRWYSPNNNRNQSDIYVTKNNSVFFKIKEIEKIAYDDDVFCFEMENKEEPYFTLPNGIITHNCRLKNEISENDFSYSLGAGGVATGSKNVITININRMVQTGVQLEDIVERVHKYQVAFNEHFKDWVDKGLLPVYTSGMITLDKQFSTIGINGVVEAAEYLGYNISDNKSYKEYLKGLLGNIKELNKKASHKYKCKFNTEFVPAENLGVKNANWDKKDGLVVPRDCYNSYMYVVEDELPLIDKMHLHGGDILNNLDGGSAVHWNNPERLTKGQYRQVIKSLIITGSNYFCENVKKTCCNACGRITANTYDKCPECGSANVDYATRVIGYLKRIKNFSKDRRIEESVRDYNEC